MKCEKTGAQILMTLSGEYATCDAYRGQKGMMIFRIVNSTVSRKPPREMTHYSLFNYDYWWDTSDENGISTMVCNTAIFHGFDGTKIE